MTISGNQSFFTSGLDESSGLDLLEMIGTISDKCHGRLIYKTTTTSLSSDNYDTTTLPAAGSPLAGPDPIPGTQDPGGKFVSWNFGWQFSPGQATTGNRALGGMSTFYASQVRAEKAHQMIGFAEALEDGEGCVFTATQIRGTGLAVNFANDCKASKGPLLPNSVDPLALKLFILDSGAGSVGLIHTDPSGTKRNAYIGRKHEFGVPYYIPTYLSFDSTLPR
jgi:hypothetical protein